MSVKPSSFSVPSTGSVIKEEVRFILKKEMAFAFVPDRLATNVETLISTIRPRIKDTSYCKQKSSSQRNYIVPASRILHLL